jgi:hypothetical protein
MKFLTENGKIEEGTPLTDEQCLQRTNLIAYFHVAACNTYHGTYSERPCENLANAFVTGAIAEVANKQPEPEQLPAPEPVIDIAVHAAEILDRLAAIRAAAQEPPYLTDPNHQHTESTT